MQEMFNKGEVRKIRQTKEITKQSIVKFEYNFKYATNKFSVCYKIFNLKQYYIFLYFS
jgi:hypothetical protein